MLHPGSCGEMQVQKIQSLELYSLSEHLDERGRMQRVWDSDYFLSAGQPISPKQVSVSKNPVRGTLRGMHFLSPEADEWKAVLCLQGSVQDVVVDAREGSETFLDHISIILDSSSNDGLLIPPGCAHGFLTLEQDTILLYMMSASYNPDLEIGFRWDDPKLGIDWRLEPKMISEKDKRHFLL